MKGTIDLEDWTMGYQAIHVKAPRCDADVIIELPNGQTIQVQLRPSNADDGYNGSLDVILPNTQLVTNWAGDDMRPAQPCHGEPHSLFAKQLVTELPCAYDNEG